MSFLEKDLHFCKECLVINKLEFYNENTIKEKYNKIKENFNQDIKIENLCFSGGGIKTISYIGGLQVLEDFDLLKNIKRIAASSAGTPIALLIAFKYKINEIRELLFTDQSRYLDRYSWSLPGLISVITGNYGFHSGNVILNEMKKLINDSFDKHFPEFRKQKSKDNDSNDKLIEYDPTFIDLYQLFGIELIITGTNLNKKTMEYFCPRLTPDMPLCIAARISMSYPLMYEYVKYNGSIYIDSICSYPLHIFFDSHNINNEHCLAQDILLPSSDTNIFDHTIGFNNYNLETNENITTTDSNSIIDIIEKNNNMQIKGFFDYIFSIIISAQYFIEKEEIRLINSYKNDEYFKHTICAILKHFNIFDLNPSEIQRSDAVTLYKIKMLEWIDDKIKSMQ